MGPVALIHMPGFFLPPQSGAAEKPLPLEIPMRIPGAHELVPLGVTLATGMKQAAHGIDAPYVLDRDPIRLRRRRFDDVPFPWVWDLAREAGRSSAVIAWPGITLAEGSATPMVCSSALYGIPADDRTWPLATPLVSSADMLDALAAARTAPGAVDIDDLFDRSDHGEMAEGDSNKHELALRRMVAGVKSGLGMLKLFCASGLDLAMTSFWLPLNARTSSVLRTRLLELILDEVRGMMGEKTTILVVGKRGHRTVLQINSPTGVAPDVVFDGPECSLLDIAPTLLGLLGVPSPSHMTGRSLLDPPTRSGPNFELTESVPEPRSDIEQLVEVLVSDQVDDLPEKRRAHLHRYALIHLRRLHRSSLSRIDFRSALTQAQLLARLNPGPLPLWHVAFAANRSGDENLVLETSRTLLAEHEGTPQALLSVFLCSTPTGSQESRVILDSIDPNELVAPSMRSVWARKALAHDRVDEGIEILSTLHDQGRAIPIDRLMLSTALLTRDETERALDVLGLLGQAPNAPLKAKVVRANALLAAGRHEEARRQADLILQHAPHHPRAVAILSSLDALGG